MSNTILHPPGADQPTLSTAVGHVHGGISIAGVSLNLFYTSEPLTHVVVGSTGDGNRRSWLGWATTAHPVTQAAVRGTGAQLGRELLAAMNSEVLCIKEALGERAEVVILVMPGSMPAGDDGQALAATPS